MRVQRLKRTCALFAPVCRQAPWGCASSHPFFSRAIRRSCHPEKERSRRPNRALRSRLPGTPPSWTSRRARQNLAGWRQKPPRTDGAPRPRRPLRAQQATSALHRQTCWRSGEEGRGRTREEEGEEERGRGGVGPPDERGRKGVRTLALSGGHSW